MTKESSANKAIVIASIISLFVSTIVLAGKFYAYHITGSQAVFSDAMESIVNVIAALLAAFVLQFASKPADREHPYGHGKIEYFSAAFEGGLIAFAAVVIVIAALEQLYHARIPGELDIAMILTVAGGLVNLFLGLYLKWIGQTRHSIAVEASGSHVMSDSLTSAGVLVTLFLVKKTGWVWLDPLVAIAMGCILAWTGYRLVRRSIGGLLDEEDLEVVSRLLGHIDRERDSAIIQLHHLRVLRSGRFHHIDAHAVLPEFWDISKAHDHVQAFETRLFEKYPFEGELHLHVDPCRKVYCRFCEVSDCPIRTGKFERRRALTLEDLVNPEEPDAFRTT